MAPLFMVVCLQYMHRAPRPSAPELRREAAKKILGGDKKNLGGTGGHAKRGDRGTYKTHGTPWSIRQHYLI